MSEHTPTIDPSELSGYLASRGWRQEDMWRGAIVWSLEPSCRLLVPDQREYEDDDELLWEAVRKLAAFEDRREHELLLDIAEPLVDRQYYRTKPDTPPGTIPLSSGLKMIQGIHELMRTAARTIVDGYQLHFEGRRSKPVEDFVHRVRLGAALPGSYILTARVPITRSPDTQTALFDDGGPDQQISRWPDDISGREVSRRLNVALDAARTAAVRVVHEGEHYGIFDEYVEQGVSSNLCKALGDLGGYAKDRPFEVGFTWARGQPVHEPSEPVAFSGSMSAALARAGRELEDLAKSGHAQITGKIETLNLTPGEEPRIKVVGELRTTAQVVRRALWVIVTMDQYDAAIEAQRNRQDLEVRGQLVTTQRRLEMRPDEFRVIDP